MTATVTAAPHALLGYNRACNVEDFSHPDLRPVIREVFAHELARFGPDFPAGHEYRKHWEVAMAVRAFRDHGVLGGSSQLLGVGVGSDASLFHLTRHAGRVFAADEYLEAGREGHVDATMLTEPERHWPFAWNPRRLVVQHMSPIDLRYEDECFDGVFSGSILDVDDGRVAERALDEVHRVLKPGGVFSLSADLLAGSDAADTVRAALGRRAWLPVSPVELDVTEATLAVTQDAEVAVRRDDRLWTRLHLTLRKADRPAESVASPPRVAGADAQRDTAPTRRLGHSKVCNVGDLSHPQLRSAMRDLPDRRNDRDVWRSAMAIRSFADQGVLDGSSDLLIVGAGRDATASALTRSARRVFATDRYLDDGGSARMLTEAGHSSRVPGRPRRLVVQHMDPLDLRHPDESFHGVYALRSLERQHDLDAVRRCVAEMHRVLRPGGVLALSTTFLASGSIPGRPGAWMFTLPWIYDLLFAECAWELPAPIDFSVSPATLAASGLTRQTPEGVGLPLHVTLRKPSLTGNLEPGAATPLR
jgi:SAM-dependent methyltransferase